MLSTILLTLLDSNFVSRHFFFTAMLFVYGRMLSQRLVNTVTLDKVLYKLVSKFVKYHMVTCYFFYIAGLFYLFKHVLSCSVWISKGFCSLTIPKMWNNKFFSILLSWGAIFHALCCYNTCSSSADCWGILLKCSLSFGIRFHVVHSNTEEEDVQVSI